MLMLKKVVIFLRFITSVVAFRAFGNIIYDIAQRYEGRLNVSDFRKLEKLNNKIKKAELDINFLNNCNTFQVYPKFIKCINLPNTIGTEKQSIYKKLLKNAITKRSKEHKRLSKDYETHKAKVRDVISSLDTYILNSAIKRNESKFIKKTLENHERKLSNLTDAVTLPFASCDVITNLSKYTLTTEEEEVLKFGLSDGIPPLKLRKSDIFYSFELISRFMTQNLKKGKNNTELRAELSHIANVYYSSYKPTKSALKKHGILKKLKNNSNICIVKPDKGNGVVILDKDKYKESILEILSDNTKFKVRKNDPTLYREGQLQRRLLNCKKKGFFTDIVYGKVYPNGSKPARIYGLPKMHKEYVAFPGFRPIISSLGTFNYALAAHLGGLLKNLLPCEYSCSDTFSFIQEVRGTEISQKFTISFDIKSLFTNIPLEETLNLAVDLIFENHHSLKISKKELLELFQFCTSKTNFLFDGKVYDQIDGIAMGSPLAPTLANLFMGHHEKTWIEHFEGDKPLVYKRYVDDIFAVFENREHALNFYEYINKQHPNIKFTKEESKEGKLPFLDVLVDNSHKLVTSVYHKPTFTGLMTNFRSFVPPNYKTNLIKTLLDRVFKITNTWVSFDSGVKELTHYLLRNSFPRKVIERHIKGFLDGIFLKSDKEEQKVEVQYFKFPYIGEYSLYIKKRVNKIFEKFCKSDKEVRVIFSTCKVRDYFSLKDSIPECFKSYVVYQFKCASCFSCYVGRTHKHMTTRMNEHLRIESSSIFKHLQGSPVCSGPDPKKQFTILDSARSDYELALKEGLYIKWLKPDLNVQKKHEVITLLV